MSRGFAFVIMGSHEETNEVIQLFDDAIFEAFGPVELVQLPIDPETGHCKGFGFVQVVCTTGTCKGCLDFEWEIGDCWENYLVHASSVTDHVGVQDSGQKTTDFDDDDGGGLDSENE